MDLGARSEPELRLELDNEVLEVIDDLGAGNGGTVSKVLHKPSGITMAKKMVYIDAKPAVRKQILRELQILHECRSTTIVSFYGAFSSDVHINMCLEYMDKGSLDAIYRDNGPIEPAVCGKVVDVVVHGLSYLYEMHRIIHRDVKPSNILVNSRGQFKLCDFGVSGELTNSIADTFVGTSTYMSPERIQGEQYSIKSDVWSLGITMVELAQGRFPFADDFTDDNEDPTLTVATAREQHKDEQQLSILELLQRIVFEPPPRLHELNGIPACMAEFVDSCLEKDPTRRPSPMDLRSHAFVREAQAQNVNVVAWLSSLRSSDIPHS